MRQRYHSRPRCLVVQVFEMPPGCSHNFWREAGILRGCDPRYVVPMLGVAIKVRPSTARYSIVARSGGRKVGSAVAVGALFCMHA